MQPLSQTVAIGSTAVLAVSAIGYRPLTYQWYFNGTNTIPGATNALLRLENLQPAQAGDYTVGVGNTAGITLSQPAFLNILPALKIDMVPAISLIGAVGLTYRLDYVNAVGSTTNWITLATITLTNSPEYYFDTSAIGQPTRFYRLMQVP